MRVLHLDENFLTFLPDLSRMTRLKVRLYSCRIQLTHSA
jgi:hypothetical protein